MRIGNEKGARLRLGRPLLLGIVGAVFWLLVFGLVYRLLHYFDNVPELGVLLASKLLGLILLSFLGLLFVSAVITALSTFFLARDLDLLASSPVHWLAVYSAKLTETTVISSWVMLLMMLPIFTAYAIVYAGGWWFPLVAMASVIPFLVIPAALGTSVTLLLVSVFPAQRTREVLSILGIVGAGATALAFRMLRPERLARPEGFRSLVDFLQMLRAPSSPWLPSEWVQRAILGWLRFEPDAAAYWLLWVSATVLVIAGALLHGRLYQYALTRSRQSSRRKAAASGNDFAGLFARFPVTRRELVMKELRVFARDTTQWSQLVLLVVLVVVYIFNVQFLPVRGERESFFLANMIPFLNLVLAGFVLASIAARFLFPALSLEGRTWWLLKSSPLSMRDLLWTKFWVGATPLVILALGIVLITDVMLRVSNFMTVVSIGTITLLTFGLAGLAVGLGTLFPQFNTSNAAQISTSFGGMVYMMLAVSLIGAVVVLEARPVYGYLNAAAFGIPVESSGMVFGFGLAAALCVSATFAPLALAARRLTIMEP